MSYYRDESVDVDPGPSETEPDDPRVELFGNDPLIPIPEIQVVPLAGDYMAAVLSATGDPDGHNLAEQVKVRLILAVDVPSLRPQAVACLISDFGLNQAQAEWLVDNAKPALPAIGREAEQGFGWQEQEHARDEHGRFLPLGEVAPSREA